MTIVAGVLGFLLVCAIGLLFRIDRDSAKDAFRARAAEEIIAERDETIQLLRDSLLAEEERRREEGEAYMEMSTRYENRISELIRQVQNMSERVASLRQEGLPEGGDDFHVEEPEVEEPWSQALREFYDGIESSEAQEMVEEYIVSARERGIADEQILNNLEG